MENGDQGIPHNPDNDAAQPNRPDNSGLKKLVTSYRRNKGMVPFTRKDVAPTALALVASGALQDREPKRHERWAINKIRKRAFEAFVEEPMDSTRLEELSELDHQTSYWHGTGRYQHQGGEDVDVLGAVLNNAALNPPVDPYTTESDPSETVSLARTRLYARAYADIHSDHLEQLNRFIKAQDAANFYVVRPAMRHGFQKAKSHPDGFIAGCQAKTGGC